jgi:hypothetical protein
VGTPAARWLDAQRWREALATAELPPADADFGDPDALAPLRTACGDLGLPALCPVRRRWPSSCCARCCGTWTA